MRRFFSDTERLLRKAKDNLESGVLQLKQWWIEKYKLPPNHALFTSQSVAELRVEMFEDLLLQREDVRERLTEVDSTREQSRLLERLNAINKVLGEGEEVQDDLVEQWERELAEGKLPDLDAR